jgi:formate/nitrite transporter FocA (FNT family)
MRDPQEIWEDGLEEGQRRLERRPVGLAATGFAGGIDVLIGIVAVAITAGAAHAVLPQETAHVVGSLVFGLGFVFITIGRAELFTENFLIPVGAVHAGRAPVSRLLRMWIITLVANFVGLAGFAAVFAADGVLPATALDAAGTMADTLGDRPALAAFLSAVAAGTVMTLFTWVVAAADTGIARIAAALIVGFVLSAAALNHAVVGFGEMIFGLLAGTARSGWADLARTIAIAIAGNFVGGVGFVFATRLAQVRGEPDSDSGRRAAAGARPRFSD